MNAKRAFQIMGIVALVLSLGWWSFSQSGWLEHASTNEAGDGACPDGSQPAYWKAPMDPTFIRDQPGKSPMGMALVPECSLASQQATDGTVTIDAATVQNMGVQTQSVTRRDLARSVRAVGRIAIDERRVVHVHTKVEGWVEKLFVDFVGQQVRRGEPLLEIYSPELVATQEELLLAARYRESTKQSPFEDVRRSGASLFEAARRRLTLWDIQDHEIERLLETLEVKRTLTLTASATGVVTRLGVRTGMRVTSDTSLYTIADLSRVWVLADVYEVDLPWIALGQMATVELSYGRSEPARGEIRYIAPFLDPMTRTAEIRLDLDNRDGRFKPEMFGNVLIDGLPRVNVLAISSSAVIRSGVRTIAVVALGQGRFEPREITLGLDSGDGWLEVKAGLHEGDRVVVSGQFLIDSESNLQEAIRKIIGPQAKRSTMHEMHHSSMVEGSM